jgi:hypothetical protein
MKYISVIDLIPGKWYHTKELNYYFLYTDIEPRDTYNRIYSSVHIKGGNYYNKRDWFSNGSMVATIEEVTDFSLIKELCPKLLPENHLSFEIY